MPQMKEPDVLSSKVLNLTDAYVEMAKRRLNPPPSIRLPEWDFFNRITDGLRMHEFSILCGATGIGKTTFLANLSRQLMLADAKQLIMSVETGAYDYVARIASVFAEFDFLDIDSVSKEQLAELTAKYDRHLLGNNVWLSLYEDRIDVEEICGLITRMHAENGIQVVFIDNLNYLLEVTSAANAIIEMDRVIHRLIVLCKTVPVHIVMVMHSRKPENGTGSDYGRVENEFQIKGSSTAVQEAQNVLLLNRPRKEDIDAGKREWSDRELKIAKMRRRGKYVGCELIFANRQTRYVERELIDVWRSAQPGPPGGQEPHRKFQRPVYGRDD